MSSLTSADKRYLEKLLGMESGYVLDFTDARFKEFFSGHQVNIHGNRYQTYGSSKAKKMRAFWEKEPDDLVARVLSDMLDFYEAHCHRKKRSPDTKLLNKCRKIVGKLSDKASAFDAVSRSEAGIAGNAAPSTAFGGEVVVYEDSDGEIRVDVRLDQQTTWLTQRQVAEVLGTTIENVQMHLRNVFRSKELEEKATAKNFLVVRTEGKRQIKRNIKHYNLDAIISVGYRVNSKRGVHFRQWATRTLRNHLVRGYTLNERQLAEGGWKEARESFDLLTRTLHSQALASMTGQAVQEIISDYADTWRLLLEYDENRLTTTPGVKPAVGVLDYEQAIRVIAKFKRELATRNEASPFFGNRNGGTLEGILNNIEQTMFGEPLYRSREEKAAHLLYFIVKDHPFVDGNKRIGSLLFLLYLNQEGVAHQLNPQSLTTLALLVAESAPDGKDQMIRLIINLLAVPGG